MNSNMNLDELIESRVELAISAVQELPELLRDTAEAKSFELLEMWWKIITHLYNNLVTPDGEIRLINEIELTVVADHDRPKYNDFIKLAYRWLVAMKCAGVAEHAMANLAGYKPKLEAEVVEGLAPHEREQCARRSNKRKIVDQAYPGLIKSEADFWLRKGALHSATIQETAESEVQDISHTEEQKIAFVKEMVVAMANMTGIADKDDHHHTKAVKAISGALFEEVAWELYVEGRDAQMGVTKVYPWSTSFTWKQYDTFADRWADMVDLMEECKSAVANLLQASYFKRYASDPHREHTRKVGQKRNNNSRAARMAANAQAAQQLQLIQGAAIIPVAAVPVAAVPVAAVPVAAVPVGALPVAAVPATANPAEGNNAASVGDADISPAFAQAAAAAVAPVQAPSDETIDGNVPMAPPNSPIVGQNAQAPELAGPGNTDAYLDGFDW